MTGSNGMQGHFVRRGEYYNYNESPCVASEEADSRLIQKKLVWRVEMSLQRVRVVSRCCFGRAHYAL